MDEKVRIQVQKERTMSGLDLQNELHSPHVEEEVLDIQGLFDDLQNWSLVSQEEVSEAMGGLEDQKETIDIQRIKITTI